MESVATDTCTGDVHLRRATPADAAAIAAVHVETWREAYRDLLPEADLRGLSVERRESFWRQELESLHGDRRPWVAEVSGRVVGFVSAGSARDDDADARTGEVYAIYVRRECWDRRIGRHLLDHAVRDLRSWGYERATLWCLTNNARTREFYERAGWNHDGSTRTDRVWETDCDEVRYRRSIA